MECHYHLQQLTDFCQLQIDATFAITQLRLINTVSNLDLSDVRNGHGDEEAGTENITASRYSYFSWLSLRKIALLVISLKIPK